MTTNPNPDVRGARKGPSTRTEVVYFMRGQRSGLTKIGYTAGDPTCRLAYVQSNAKEPLELLGTTPGGASLEEAYHLVFADLRVRGEWFRDLPAVDSPDMDPANVWAKSEELRAAILQEFKEGCDAVKRAEEAANSYLRTFPPGPKRRAAIRLALGHGWTQANVARALGVSRQRITQILSE